MSTMAMPQPTAAENAVRYLVTNYSPKGNKVGWLMMASILVEAWDLYSIAFVLIFIREQYNPDPLPARRAARLRYLDRLHLHHGIHGQGRARGHGQPLAVHVRDRRGAYDRRHRAVPPERHESRDAVACD